MAGRRVDQPRRQARDARGRFAPSPQTETHLTFVGCPPRIRRIEAAPASARAAHPRVEAVDSPQPAAARRDDPLIPPGISIIGEDVILQQLRSFGTMEADGSNVIWYQMTTQGRRVMDVRMAEAPNNPDNESDNDASPPSMSMIRRQCARLGLMLLRRYKYMQRNNIGVPVEE